MTVKFNVAVLVGSLRKESFNPNHVLRQSLVFLNVPTAISPSRRRRPF